MPDQLMTVSEVADELRLSVRTVQERIRLKEIKSVKLGYRTVRVFRSDLDAYLEAGRQAECK